MLAVNTIDPIARKTAPFPGNAKGLLPDLAEWALGVGKRLTYRCQNGTMQGWNILPKSLARG